MKSDLELRQARLDIESIINGTIMKLNETSMDKLFDLAIMLCKYQTVCCTTASHLLEVTQRHLAGVIDIGSRRRLTSCNEILQKLRSRLDAEYSAISEGQMHRLRQGVLRVLQERRVKVSVLLESGIQNRSDGSIKLPSPEGEGLGKIALAEESGAVSKPTPVPGYLEPYVSYDDAFHHTLPLGTNMFRAKNTDPSSSVSHEVVLSPSPALAETHDGGRR